MQHTANKEGLRMRKALPPADTAAPNPCRQNRIKDTAGNWLKIAKSTRITEHLPLEFRANYMYYGEKRMKGLSDLRWYLYL